MTVCQACNGEGKVANTETKEPWSVWENLPEESKIAVKLGLVYSIDCVYCRGTGNIENNSVY